MKSLVREATPIRASEIRLQSAEYLTVPSVFAFLWVETLPEDVLLRVMDLFGVPREQARPMIARFVSTGWMTLDEVSPETYVFTLSGTARTLVDKIMAPELRVEWPGAFDQLMFHFQDDSQPELADRIRYISQLVGVTEVAPGVLLGFTDMTDVVAELRTQLEPGNLIETAALAVSADQARRILPIGWDYEALRAQIAEKRRLLREADDSGLRGAGAVRRMRDLYLDRMLLISGPGRIPEAVRPHHLGIWRMADEYAQRLDQLDDITDPLIDEAVAECEHADLVVYRPDEFSEPRGSTRA